MNKKVRFENEKRMYLKWTNNTKPERTPRNKQVVKEESKDTKVINLVLDDLPQPKTEQLNNYNTEGEMIVDFDRLVNEGFVKNNNKRDGQNEKLLSRGMIIQKSINPFLNTNNYIEHLDAEDEFLRPRDSNLQSQNV